MFNSGLDHHEIRGEVALEPLSPSPSEMKSMEQLHLGDRSE
jgi:hypothetical protein